MLSRLGLWDADVPGLPWHRDPPRAEAEKEAQVKCPNCKKPGFNCGAILMRCECGYAEVGGTAYMVPRDKSAIAVIGTFQALGPAPKRRRKRPSRS